MKLVYKRILIMFSVALNIGFVIMATFIMLFHNSWSSHKHFKNKDIIHSLNLPKDQEDKALECINRFKTIIKKQDQEIRLARDNIILFLGKDGPLNQNQLHQLYGIANNKEARKNRLFEAHVIEMRNLLGDEKGAQFYSLLLKHLKNKNDKSHHK